MRISCVDVAEEQEEVSKEDSGEDKPQAEDADRADGSDAEITFVCEDMISVNAWGYTECPGTFNKYCPQLPPASCMEIRLNTENRIEGK